MDEITELKRKRFQFLHRLYQVTKGEKKAVDTWKLAEGLGLTDDETRSVVRHLKEENLIGFVAPGSVGAIFITHQGIIQIENVLSNLEELTRYRPAVNTINTQQTINSQTQQRIRHRIETEVKNFQVKQPQIFLCYAREDEERVKNLYQRLSDEGFKPWMDKKDILPGELWENAIRKAIRGSDFFVACLSVNSVDKRGFLQKEIKYALDIWQEKLEDDIYLIPVRLEDCEVPEDLHKFHWVDLFENDGWERLVKAIKAGMERRG